MREIKKKEKKKLDFLRRSEMRALSVRDQRGHRLIVTAPIISPAPECPSQTAAVASGGLNSPLS